MSEIRKKYSPAEKAKIALEAIKGELTLAQISAKYAVHATQIKAWKAQVYACLPDLFSDKKKRTEIGYENQLTELFEIIGRLKVENDFLKKKLEVVQ